MLISIILFFTRILKPKKLPIKFVKIIVKIINFLDSLIPLPRSVEYSRNFFKNFFIELIVPKNRKANKTILYCHGGGFLLGLNILYRRFAAKLAIEANAKVWLIEYPLLPNSAFPLALKSCIEAYFFLVNQNEQQNNIIIMGDSAGGNLALALIAYLNNKGLPLPAAAITFSPLLDLSFSGNSTRTKEKLDPFLTLSYLAEVKELYLSNSKSDVYDPLVSPLFADLKNFPPLLMQVGENEILYDDTIRFAKKAKESGVSVRLMIGIKMPHIYPLLFPKHTESLRAFRCIIRFIRKIELSNRDCISVQRHCF